ncbi:dnaJ homolog subfamily C member 17 isoform X3 [Carettochelys insculpta]|uniref:dnaJ homolog subfamily C member 17 isoform X3 n=1 Tax=Carettochelys insculpta TaxID=44489 RepID=UPI003EB8C2DC
MDKCGIIPGYVYTTPKDPPTQGRSSSIQFHVPSRTCKIELSGVAIHSCTPREMQGIRDVNGRDSPLYLLLYRQIIRLREEGSRQLEEQQKLIQEQIRLERAHQVQGRQHGNGVEGKGTPKLKLRWKCKKDDETKGGYSKEVLLQILQKYGEVLNLVISSKKTGSAVVEFATVKAAEMAVKNEVGLINNPLKISWLEGEPQNNPSTKFPDSTSQARTSQDSVLSARDYESLVMMRMRQAAERQQLIEQLQREEEEESHT